MAFHIPQDLLDAMKENSDNEIKKEMKKNRKKNTKWEEVRTYPSPCQCEAIRYISPRGKQQLFRTLRKVKTFLWFTKDVPIKVVCTSIPVCEDGEYFWKQVKEEPYNSQNLNNTKEIKNE